jgi:hypothetical protein
VILLASLAPYFERYMTLERIHPTATYNYKARGFCNWPVIDVTMHRPKCTPGSWLYVAVPAGADLAALRQDERLYIGSQTGDRMFRGDGLRGQNFHHAQMRAGNGDDTPINYLRSGRRVDLHRLDETSMRRALADVSSLATLAIALGSFTKNHLGYWLEHVILAIEAQQWRWNTAAADREAVRIAGILRNAA